MYQNKPYNLNSDYNTFKHEFGYMIKEGKVS